MINQSFKSDCKSKLWDSKSTLLIYHVGFHTVVFEKCNCELLIFSFIDFQWKQHKTELK